MAGVDRMSKGRQRRGTSTRIRQDGTVLRPIHVPSNPAPAVSNRGNHLPRGTLTRAHFPVPRDVAARAADALVDARNDVHVHHHIRIVRDRRDGPGCTCAVLTTQTVSMHCDVLDGSGCRAHGQTAAQGRDYCTNGAWTQSCPPSHHVSPSRRHPGADHPTAIRWQPMDATVPSLQ